MVSLEFYYLAIFTFILGINQFSDVDGSMLFAGDRNDKFTSGKIRAHALIIYPNPRKSCSRFIPGEYVFDNDILSNGYTIIKSGPNAIKEISSKLKKFSLFKKTFTFYVGKHYNDYVIYKDRHVQEPNMDECLDAQRIEELPQVMPSVVDYVTPVSEESNELPPHPHVIGGVVPSSYEVIPSTTPSDSDQYIKVCIKVFNPDLVDFIQNIPQRLN